MSITRYKKPTNFDHKIRVKAYEAGMGIQEYLSSFGLHKQWFYAMKNYRYITYNNYARLKLALGEEHSEDDIVIDN